MQLPEMKNAVWTLVLIGMLLGVGLFILAQLRDNMVTDETNSITANVTQVTGLTANTNKGLPHDRIINSTFLAVNYTGDYTFQAGVDYHLDASAGYLTPTTLGITRGEVENWNLSYSYVVDTSDAAAGVNKTLAGINEFPQWITIIVVIIAAMIIVGLVVGKFGGTGVM
jgi:hypothetical protein